MSNTTTKVPLLRTPLRVEYKAGSRNTSVQVVNAMGGLLFECDYPEKATLIAMRVNVHSQLVKALMACKRAPGIHTTDQETGEVFSDLIDAALSTVQP